VDHHRRKHRHVRPVWPPAHRQAGDHDRAGIFRAEGGKFAEVWHQEDAPGHAAPARLEPLLWVPKTSSMSRDQAIFVDRAVGAGVFSGAVLLEIGRFGWRFQRGSAVQ
jgi:hypothetical protein